MISKELFVSVLESIQKQIATDKKNASLVAEAFGIDDFNLYDNSLLINSIMAILRVDFPRDKSNFCEIEHYCFFLNFGKLSSEDDFETFEQFYDRLIKEKNNL